VTTAQTHRLWQRFPYGWIEFRAFGEATPAQWLENYLASGDGWLPDDARDAITKGFHAGVSLFEDTGFASAGVSFTFGERPAVNLLCTNVVISESPDGLALHRSLPLGRFGEDSTAETFTAPDGRVGTISVGTLDEGGMEVIVAVGEIRLPDGAGSVVVMGVCTDTEQRIEIGVLTAFMLAMTQYLPEGEEPALPAGMDPMPPEELGRRLLEALQQQASQQQSAGL